jgi:hypothetical protein
MGLFKKSGRASKSAGLDLSILEPLDIPFDYDKGIADGEKKKIEDILEAIDYKVQVSPEGKVVLPPKLLEFIELSAADNKYARARGAMRFHGT